MVGDRVRKSLPTKESTGPDCHAHYQTLKEKVMPILLKLPKMENNRIFHSLFRRLAFCWYQTQTKTLIEKNYRLISLANIDAEILSDKV